MPLNSAALAVKLGAILAKNPDELIANGVYLPFIGKNYTRASLVAWLKKRSDVLQQVIDGAYTDAQIANFINGQYNKLSKADKTIADAIKAGADYDLALVSDATAYENIILIVLAKFAVTP